MLDMKQIGGKLTVFLLVECYLIATFLPSTI